jgi:hypothetical protein
MTQRSRHWNSWIAAQLVGIRSLEIQLQDSLKSGGGRNVDARRCMVELQLRLELVERALSVFDVRYGQQAPALQQMG